jgi:hypothetical protein
MAETFQDDDCCFWGSNKDNSCRTMSTSACVSTRMANSTCRGGNSNRRCDNSVTGIHTTIVNSMTSLLFPIDDVRIGTLPVDRRRRRASSNNNRCTEADGE